MAKNIRECTVLGIWKQSAALHKLRKCHLVHVLPAGGEDDGRALARRHRRDPARPARRRRRVAPLEGAALEVHALRREVP